MSLIQRAREFFTGSGVVCPRCEKPLEGHDEKACDRQMSRRFFFGVIGRATLGASVAPAVSEFTLSPGKYFLAALAEANREASVALAKIIVETEALNLYGTLQELTGIQVKYNNPLNGRAEMTATAMRIGQVHRISRA